MSAFKQDSRYLSEMWSAALLLESYPIIQHSITRNFGSGETLEFSKVPELGTKGGWWLLANCSISAVWDRSSLVPSSSSIGLLSQQAALGSFCCLPNRLLSSSWAWTHVLLKVRPNSLSGNSNQEGNGKKGEISRKYPASSTHRNGSKETTILWHNVKVQNQKHFGLYSVLGVCVSKEHYPVWSTMLVWFSWV